MPSSPLGTPIPNLPHAVSVSLPTMDDVIRYEEKDPAVCGQLQTGYPRFRGHDNIPALNKRFAHCAEDGFFVMAFPSRAAARKCLDFVGEGSFKSQKDYGLCFVRIRDGQEQRAKAKAFWQHAGIIVSSRHAENVLEGRKPQDATEAKAKIREQIADWSGMSEDDVYLYPSGMAAIFHAYQIVTSHGRRGKTIQLGMPYRDTLDIQQKFGKGAQYVRYNSPDDLDEVERLVNRGGISGVFCEIPSNPLLHTIDLARLRSILRPRGIPTIIDDTIGSYANVNVRALADMTVNSGTKYLSGVGDVMAGILTLNDTSPLYARLKNNIEGHNNRYEDNLYPDDAIVLEEHMRGYLQRMFEINRNGELVADFLKAHPKVDQVWYPKFTDREQFDAIRTQGGGFGGLISFTLKNPAATGLFYDNIDVQKGPSLGTDFTMLCLYAYLLHYHEFDWAEKEGIPRNILRTAVGREQNVIAPYQATLNLV